MAFRYAEETVTAIAHTEVAWTLVAGAEPASVTSIHAMIEIRPAAATNELNFVVSQD